MTPGARDARASPTPVLVERESTIATIRDLLARAAAGRGGAVFVIGEAGLGKTSLLDCARSLVEGAFRVGIGRGDAVEATLPFGVLDQALESLLDDPFKTRSELSAAARFWAVLQQLQQSATRPRLIALDDLQWADPDSLALIHLLCRRLAGLPIALIGTARPWPSSALSMAQDLTAADLAVVARLAPLSPTAAATVLRAHAHPATADVGVERALALAGGNPLLLVQLAETAATAPAMGEPAEYLVARFLDIDAVERRLVDAASVLGTRFRTAVAADIAGIRESQAADAFDHLFRRGLLRDVGQDSAEFAHALIRQAVYDNLTTPARIHLHRLAFRVLLARHAGVAEAARHATAGHLIGDATAVRTVALAGREALASGAVRAARRHFEVAVELAGESPPGELLLELAAASLADGATEDAIGLDERVLGTPSLPDVIRATALSHLGRSAFVAGHLQRASVAFEAVARLSHVDRDLRVSAMLDYAFWTWACMGPRAGLDVAARARDLSSEASASLRASAEAAWGLCAWGVGDPVGLSAAREAAYRFEVAGLLQAGAVHWALEPSGVPGDIAVWAERFEEAELLFASLSRSAELHREPFALFHAAFSWSDGLCRLGRLDEALALADRVFEVADVAPGVLAFAAAARALVLLEQGRLHEASDCCDKLADLASDHRWFLVRGYDLHRRATLAWRSGRVVEACELFERLEGLANEWGLRDPSTIPWAGDAVFAYMACDRAADAQRVVEWLLEGSDSPSLWPRVAALTGRAAMAESAGELDSAELHYLEAVSLQAGMRLPLRRADTLIEFGAFLVRRGEMARARPVLGEALELAEQAGARWHLDRARVEWRRAGGRARRTAPGDLTPQEGAVSALARAGRTNRQIARQLFLSEHTVETHLAHVYRKLGIRRRWELIARGNGVSNVTPPADW